MAWHPDHFFVPTGKTLRDLVDLLLSLGNGLLVAGIQCTHLSPFIRLDHGKRTLPVCLIRVPDGGNIPFGDIAIPDLLRLHLPVTPEIGNLLHQAPQAGLVLFGILQKIRQIEVPEIRNIHLDGIALPPDFPGNHKGHHDQGSRKQNRTGIHKEMLALLGLGKLVLERIKDGTVHRLDRILAEKDFSLSGQTPAYFVVISIYRSSFAGRCPGSVLQKSRPARRNRI